MLKKLEQLSSELVIDNKYWKYKIDEYKMPNGNIGNYHYVDSRGASFVIPYYKGLFYLVKQYRYLNGKTSIEFPGGGIKDKSNAKDTAIEELKEEAGLIADSINKIGEHNPYNGVTNEICHVFYTDNVKIAEQDLDESEEIEIIKLNYNEINNYIANNIIWDGMTLAAWSLFICSKYYKGIK